MNKACAARLKTIAPVVQRKPISEPVSRYVLKYLATSGHLQPIQHVIDAAIECRSRNSMPKALDWQSIPSELKAKLWHPVRRQDQFNKGMRFEQLG